ncbi:MAG: ATP-binding protein [Coxiellaceae bacterium]|nr:ATP-binding protein [Coxiellaceae bacterium]
MDRIYETIMDEHLRHDRQMVFLAGPRQVGKTTISKTAADLTSNYVYLNWDYEDDQELILQGPQTIMDKYNLQQPQRKKAILTLDEIHKFKDWRNYLKGFYDKTEELIRFIVTGSSKMDTYRHSGDSLMGRYFPYRVHPLSVAELLSCKISSDEIKKPKKLSEDIFKQLIMFGGFPEPFMKQTKAFYNRWQKMRSEQLFETDIREVTRIHEIKQMKFLATMLVHQASELLVYSNFAKKVRTSVDTIQSWIETLESFYYCFRVQPWSKNIVRSLMKQPKMYLWDWASVSDEGARHENMIASHLLKAIQLWQDRGLGDYGLYFIRDKEKREVDFLVVKNDKPWFLVEVKSSANQPISKYLHYFQKQLNVPHAFQVVFGLPYQPIDCFEYSTPIIVPALTFLSQLV